MTFEPATESQEEKLYDSFVVSTNIGAPDPQILYNAHSQQYTVEGANVSLMKDVDQLPVKFARVSGSFYAGDSRLTTLEGCPEWVGEYFAVSSNPLKDLDHSPLHVGGYFAVSYREDLPLLRMLVAKDGVRLGRAPLQLIRIMNRYQGQGQQGALACAAELADAGFKGNARW